MQDLQTLSDRAQLALSQSQPQVRVRDYKDLNGENLEYRGTVGHIYDGEPNCDACNFMRSFGGNFTIMHIVKDSSLENANDPRP